MNKLENYLNPKDIKYGLIVVDPTQEGEMLEVLHFVGYWDKPNKHDVEVLRQELMTDEEFGLTEIIHRCYILPVPDDIVEEFLEGLNNNE
jgi:hypothetical protein